MVVLLSFCERSAREKSPASHMPLPFTFVMMSPAAFFYRAYQHGLAVFRPEEFAQLGCEIFDHQSTTHGGMNDHDGNGHVVHRRKFGHRWNRWRLKVVAVIARVETGGGTPPVGKLDFHREGLPVATETKSDDASGRNFVNHPAQLLNAFNRRPVHRQNDVALFDAGFSRRRVLVDHGDFDAVLFFKLEVG